MAWGYGVPCPKPSAKLTDRIAYKKDREQKERDFRAKVWARDKGECQRCGIKVIKTLTLDARRGEVHHVKPRSTAPDQKLNVANAELVCAVCHLKLTRHVL